MSFQEKSGWWYGVLAVVLPAVYAAIVLPQVTTTAPAEIDYIRPMITVIVIALVLNIVGAIVLSIASRERGKADERDQKISRRSDLAGYYTLAGGVIGALAITMARLDPFWIANAIYGAFILSALVTTVVKLTAYRRGI